MCTENLAERATSAAINGFVLKERLEGYTAQNTERERKREREREKERERERERERENILVDYDHELRNSKFVGHSPTWQLYTNV